MKKLYEILTVLGVSAAIVAAIFAPIIVANNGYQASQCYEALKTAPELDPRIESTALDIRTCIVTVQTDRGPLKLVYGTYKAALEAGTK